MTYPAFARSSGRDEQACFMIISTEKRNTMNVNETKRTEWRDLRTEPELSISIDTDTIRVRVHIEKAGGGTVGRAYVGDWNVEVLTADGAAYWVPTYTGTPKSHDGVAQLAADYVANQR